MIGVIYLTLDGCYKFYCRRCVYSHWDAFDNNDRVWTASDKFSVLNLRCSLCHYASELLYDPDKKLFPEGIPEKRNPQRKDFEV